MQQAAESAASPSVSGFSAASFAGLLATLTASDAATPKSSLKWNDDDLADDVATLSYESALRTHSRYHHEAPSQAGTADGSLAQPPAAIPLLKSAPKSRSKISLGDAQCCENEHCRFRKSH